MKKLILFTISILFIVAACKKKSDDSTALAGEVNMMKGSVSIKSSDGLKKAKIGDSVRQGMEIITGSNSFVDIYFGNNAVKILSDSNVKISVLIKDSKGSSNQEFFVQKGKVFSRIASKLMKGESYKVSTPTAVAAVRGTDFLVEQKRDRSSISCLNGKLQVKKTDTPDAPPIDINGGQVADIEKDKPIGVRELKGKNKENIENILKNISVLRKDIRKQFEKERDEIRKMVKEAKEKNKKMVQDQRDKDKENIRKIKEGQKEEREKIKKDLDETKKDLKSDVQKQKEKTKIDKDAIKPKIDVNSFKK